MSDTKIDDLHDELKSLANTLEEVLEAPHDKSKIEIDRLRENAKERLKVARARLSEAGDKLSTHTKQAADYVDTCVREKPWHCAGAAAVLGALLGILISRR